VFPEGGTIADIDLAEIKRNYNIKGKK